MRELSLNILDIAQNSLSAGAGLVTLTVDEDSGADSLTLRVEDDGRGMDADTLALLRFLHLHEKEQLLAGSRAGILIDGENDLFTKDLGRRIAFAASLCGCALPGKPLVESTSDLHSFTVLASLWQTDRYTAYLKSCRLLVEKLRTFAPAQITRPKLLAVHAGNHKTSNSLSLWQLTAAALAGKADIAEISLRNGQIWDCRGCKYEDCLHFGEQGDCFYGGVMTEKVYPAIIKSDVVVLICPNYNDSVSANIMAFINRLTSVFRVNDFSAKRVYAIIVSGYSGGDLVAQQIIGAMSAVGGLLIIALGINMLEVTKIRIGNLLPAMFLPILYYPIADWIGGLL